MLVRKFALLTYRRAEAPEEILSTLRASHAYGIDHPKQKQVGQFYFGMVGQISIGTDTHFAERQLAFYFFLVEQWRGTPCGNEGQPERWCPQQALKAEEFPPANAAIILQLMVD